EAGRRRGSGRPWMTADGRRLQLGVRRLARDARNHERDLLGDPFRAGLTLARRPLGKGLVAEADHPAVPRAVLVDLRIEVDIAELLPQQLDVSRAPGQEQPAGARAVHPRIFLELFQG